MVSSLLQIALIVILLIGCIEGLSMTYFQLMTALYTKTKGPNVIQDENATSWMDDDSSNHHPGEMATDINETHNTYKNNHGNHHQHHQYLESTNNNAPILGLLEENGIARLFIGGQKFRPYFSICCALIGFSFLLQA
ncbi:hypothetical protein DASC09_032300 [Saccharomycopsis crataegensis]|uniref:Uncharacterized protein n=1 Tax=Saccharomycopsis crataegensis TaxID=43959 RepID=A0AAV5QLR9_9ASCO|nr:hypothetical protein DASC09_032300 [Saccharomycopsis crataegensis]